MDDDLIPDEPSARSAALSKQGVACLAVFYILLFLALAYLMIALWPVDYSQASSAGDLHTTQPLWSHVRLFWYLDLHLATDMRLILLVMVVGALGSLIPSATSFAVRVANHTMSGSWLLWYILHPLIAMALAAIIYLAVRGGFLNPNATTGQVNVYSAVALAGLVGWFSRQAATKMEEVFTNLFKTEPPKPAQIRMIRILPTTVAAGSAKPISVIVSGANFTTASVVRLDGSDQPTNFIDATQLSVSLPPEKAVAPGLVQVTVFDPSNAKESAPLFLEVK